MTVNALWLATHASQLIASADALFSAVPLRPTHFQHVSTFRAIDTFHAAPVFDPVVPTHFQHVSTFNPIVVEQSEGSGDDEVIMGPRRYWRLYLIRHSANAFALDTLELRTSPGGGQAATGGSPIESGHFGSEVPANAFDASVSKWSSSFSEEGAYIGYDFGAGNEVEIVEVAIKSYTSEANQTPWVFILQGSDDGITWRNKFMGQTTPDWSTGETRVFTAPAT